MQWFIDNRPDFRESLQKFHYFLRDSFKVELRGVEDVNAVDSNSA